MAMKSSDFIDFANDISNEKVVADVVAQFLGSRLFGQSYLKYFPIWQEKGFHVTPNHFYQPIPDTRTLSDYLFAHESALPGVDMNEAGQLQLLHHVFPRFQEEFLEFPDKPTGNPYDFYFNNNFFDGTDALVLYCMVRHFRPKLMIESGCGNSTRVSAKAAMVNGSTELICIEPYPPDYLAGGMPGVTRLYQEKIENVDIDFFASLNEGDILFIDTSHVVKCGGDVNRIYLEVLPRLNKGVIVHIHDIFFPMEYPKCWVKDEFRFWTEQYLLQAFLAFNSAFEVLFSNSYMGLKHHDVLKEVFPNSRPYWGGGSFWMRKKA